MFSHIVQNVRLIMFIMEWNKDPYLYTANVTVYNENDEVLDTVSDNFGVRTYEIKKWKILFEWTGV